MLFNKKKYQAVQEVLADLLNMVNSTDVWGAKTLNAESVTYLSAKDFGRYVEDKSKTSTTS